MEDQHANNNQESAVIDYQHQLQQCQIDLAASNEKLRESREKYTYLLADWDNFKRRMEKERAQWIVNAQAAVFTDVLGIVDDFERAFNDINAKGLPEELKTRFQGFELIHKSFLKLLAKYGIEEIKQNDTFDPTLHEAVTEVPDSGKASGEIATVLQKGYMFKGQILRAAKVSVAR